MQTIIVATNFSTAADNALHFAAAALHGKPYQIILFNFFVTSIHVLNTRLPADEIDRLTAIRKDTLQDMADHVSANYGVDTKPYLASGNFLEQLTRCVENFDAQMVVMGMAEKSFEQDLLGNTTTMLINKLKCPVLSIPLHARYNGINKVLFACDVVRGVHKTVIDNVRSFAKSFGATVEIFHVKRFSHQALSSDMMEPILSLLSDVQPEYKDIHAEFVIKAIEQELISSQADILIMVPYRYGFWSSMVHKSLTRTMASSSQVPLLSIQLLT